MRAVCEWVNDWFFLCASVNVVEDDENAKRKKNILLRDNNYDEIIRLIHSTLCVFASSLYNVHALNIEEKKSVCVSVCWMCVCIKAKSELTFNEITSFFYANWFIVIGKHVYCLSVHEIGKSID